MANEYLQRTPTSAGNRKVHTVSVWVKVSDGNATDYRTFFAAGASSPAARSAVSYKHVTLPTSERG